ncbi:hypothetical protein DFAR_550004 [Desulfarculales bacterium]
MLHLNLSTYGVVRLAPTPLSQPQPLCPNRSSYRSCPGLDRQPPMNQKTPAQKRWPYLKNY